MLALNRKRAISSDEDCTYKQEKKQTIDQTKEVDESDQEHDERESYYRRLVGNFFMVGFEGTSVNEEIASLISKYYIGSIILSGRNFIDATQTKKLITDLQAIAKNSGYKYPIIFVIDEEGGMLNSLFDREFVTQFPGAMAMGAAGSVDLTYKVYRSIAKELKSIGFSMYLGPVLDILKYRVATFIQQMIGVRAYGYNAQSVVEMGRVAAKAFKDEQLFNCGKHFPGYGSATINSNFELPMILESTEQLFESSLIPYMELIKEDLLDSILVGGCAVPGVNNNDLHACLSPTIVTNILRDQLNFRGVVVSECLLLEALDRNFGVVQGCISAFSVGCDLIMLCSNYRIQREAIVALKSVIEDCSIDQKIVENSLDRIHHLHKKLPSWTEVLADRPMLSPDVIAHHKSLSMKAYEKSITVIRDAGLPINKYLNENVENENTILILTPLITPLYETIDKSGHKSHINSIDKTEFSKLNLNYGEDVFIKFGQYLSKYRSGYNILHSSYNSNGITSFHEELILKSKVILFFCAETSNNLYQVGVSKHVSMLCNSVPNRSKVVDTTNSKKMIIISVASPTDFLYDINLGGSPTGYVCTYDYTFDALYHLPKILFGERKATGKIPGLIVQSTSKTANVEKNNHCKHSWLVETFNFKRDWNNLVTLLKNNNYLAYSEKDSVLTSLKLLMYDTENHCCFVVRNTSLNIILGFSSAWVYPNHTKNSIGGKTNIGNFMFLLVDRNKRDISIGNYLYTKTVKYLFEDRDCFKVYLGRNFPKFTTINDLLLNPTEGNNRTLEFFKSYGCDLSDEASVSAISSHLGRAHTGAGKSKLQNLQGSCNLGFGINQSIEVITDENILDKSTGVQNGPKSQLDVNILKKKVKCLMKLDNILSWKVSENLVRQLQVVGIMFDICRNPADILSSQNSTSNDIERQLDLSSHEIYSELLKDFNSCGKDKQYFDGSSNLQIIVAIEPLRKSIVGSLVVFNDKSKFSKFYPSLQFSTELQLSQLQRYACIAGLFVDPSYTALSEVFELGLICTALMFVKGQHKDCPRVFITDVNENQVKSLNDNGFDIVDRYYNYYGVIIED